MPEPAPQPPPGSPALPAAAGTVISFEEFKRLELVVGEIQEAVDHPKADKLLLLKIDLGSRGVRQMVAGIRGCYQPAQLVGRQVAVVANLAPAVIRGERSEGMILAAEGPGGVPVLLALDQRIPSGSKIR
jgi:methionyl-tRNA synthetase